MPEKDKLSQTMRIDLIPDVPGPSNVGHQRRIVVSTSELRGATTEGVSPSSDDLAGGAEYFHELFQSVYDGALITDLSGRVVDANVRAVDFFQYSRAELRGLTLFDLISGANELLIQTLWENLESERFALIQAYCLRRDETCFPSEIAVNKLKLGTPHLCFFVRDITLRRREQEMLRTEHSALQNAGNGIAVADLEARIEYANPAAARMWGFASPEDMQGVDARLLLADPTEFSGVINGVMSDQQTWAGERRARMRDGAEFDTQISVTCNRNTDGEPVGFVLSFVDVSDRKRAQQAEREAERNRVMLESLGAACHHLGQPATVLLTNLGVMQARMATTDEMLKDLVDNSIHAAEILREILHRLNAVNEYKTMQYIKQAEGAGDQDSNRILAI
jgi:PAS domain S-box-containing protein